MAAFVGLEVHAWLCRAYLRDPVSKFLWFESTESKSGTAWPQWTHQWAQYSTEHRHFELAGKGRGIVQDSEGVVSRELPAEEYGNNWLPWPPVAEAPLVSRQISDAIAALNSFMQVNNGEASDRASQFEGAGPRLFCIP